MKASQIAKQLLTEEFVGPIFMACQQQLNSVSHICVSRELNESDTQIIGEVILDSIRATTDKVVIDQPKVKEALTHRAEGLFIQWLKKQKETQNDK